MNNHYRIVGVISLVNIGFGLYTLYSYNKLYDIPSYTPTRYGRLMLTIGSFWQGKRSTYSDDYM